MNNNSIIFVYASVCVCLFIYFIFLESLREVDIEKHQGLSECGPKKLEHQQCKVIARDKVKRNRFLEQFRVVEPQKRRRNLQLPHFNGHNLLLNGI